MKERKKKSHGTTLYSDIGNIGDNISIRDTSREAGDRNSYLDLSGSYFKVKKLIVILSHDQIN